MLEQLIERLIEEGKISQEEINQEIDKLKAKQPPVIEDIVSLKKRQEETENVLMALLLGGM